MISKTDINLTKEQSNYKMDQMDIDKTLLKFVTLHTKEFDSSHDVHHAIAVYRNALDIAKYDYLFLNTRILMYACLLHDVCDHKYDHSLSKEDRNAFIQNQLVNPVESQCVIDVIENISFSQEVKGLRKTLPFPDNMFQDIVSDADKLEAIGQVGLDRCIAFTIAKGGKLPDEVIQHCHDKLLKIKDNYMRTPRGKELAIPLHKVIVDYVKRNSEV
jgi:uncharacterized protein